jgi:3-hydroxyisobutyrate dehydrogenase-like beta-hydroxyacid dehydrogenase
LLDKDLGIARDLVAASGVPGPVFEVSSGVLGQARAELGEEADYLEAIRWIEQHAGVEIRG